MSLSIMKGNLKLPKETLTFSLPPEKTCPNATEECKKFCYAKKAYRMYPQTRKAWDNNFLETLNKNFIFNMYNEIGKQKKWEQFRIHVSGDMYHKKYFIYWCIIIRKFPDKIFYSYTKNITLNLENKPSNFLLIFSDDKKLISMKELLDKGFNGRARVDDGRKMTKNEFLCQGSCTTCNYCYNNDGKFKQVVFKKH